MVWQLQLLEKKLPIKLSDNRLNIALILCIIGSVNWGLIGLLNFNLVDTLFGVGSLISIIIYILVGVSGFISILTLIDLIEKK